MPPTRIVHPHNAIPPSTDRAAAATALPRRVLYPKAEAAVLLGISLRKVGYLIADGELKSRRIGGRRLVHVDEILRFAKRDHPLR